MINTRMKMGLLSILTLLAFQPVDAEAAAGIFARIRANGTVQTSRSQGVTQSNVDHPFLGLYCFSEIDGIKGAQVTVDFSTTNADETAQFAFGNNGGQCTEGTQFFVQIFDPGEGVTADEGGFFILLYK